MNGAIRIFVDGEEYIPTVKDEKAVMVEMWWDRHRREWVLYPVDEQGNQLDEARYGFNKAEALMIKKDIETEFAI